MRNKSNILLGIMILSAFMCSFSSFIGYRIIIVICMLFLTFRDNLYLSYPIVLFFYSQFGTLFGLSILRLFSIILIINYIILIKEKRYKISFNNLLLLGIYIIYIVFILFFDSPSLGFSTLLNTIAIGIMAFFCLKDTTSLIKFFKVYNIVALLSIPAGLKQANSMINQQYVDGVMVETSRFMGTFDDPNYLTFFCYIAIISLLTLKLFDNRVRVILICIFQICIFSTLSITGIVCGGIIWLLYLVLTHKLKIRYLIVIFCICICVFVSYKYGLENQEIPILSDLAFRLSEKLHFLNSGDIRGVTTGRSALSQMHLEYFCNQNIGKKLIGGNLANTKIISLGNIHFAAHNEYIDLLLNIGIIGTVIYFTCIIKKIIFSCKLKQIDEKKADYYNCLIMIKVMWIFYATTLTLFLEERFMLFVFL